MKKFKRHITSEEEGKIIGHKIKLKRKKMPKVNVYFNKKNSSGDTKYLSGKFYSKKNDDNYTYRSSYELKCFLTLEKDPNVISYLSETLSIPYKDSYGTKRTYVPDLLVLFKDGSLCVWEIKPEEMLKDIDVQLKAKACRTFLEESFKEHNIDYKFITEKVLFGSNKEYYDFVKSVKIKNN